MEHQDCHNMLGSLSEYIDGALGSELCNEIERHMSECENCRIVVDTLRKTIYLYRVTTPGSALPQDVRNRLFHRLDLDEFLDKPR